MTKCFIVCLVVICALALSAPINHVRADVCDSSVSKHNEVLEEYCANSAASQKLIAQIREDMGKTKEASEQQKALLASVDELTAQISVINKHFDTLVVPKEDPVKISGIFTQAEILIARAKELLSQYEEVKKKVVTLTAQEDKRMAELTKLEERRGELFEILKIINPFSPGQET